MSTPTSYLICIGIVQSSPFQLLKSMTKHGIDSTCPVRIGSVQMYLKSYFATREK